MHKLTMLIMAFVAFTAFSVTTIAQINTEDKPKVVKTSSTASTAYQTFSATAYSLRGRTASGENTRQGIIAADPRVLPLGTIVHIENMGTFVVKDTGGAIKGNRIDIWMPNGAAKFGRRPVKLRVVSRPNRKVKI